MRKEGGGSPRASALRMRYSCETPFSRDLTAFTTAKYLLSAKGAPSSAAWGNAPGHAAISNPSALKARFIEVVDNMKSDEEHSVS